MDASLASEAVPVCALCGGTRSAVAYDGLTDRLFSAPGSWTLRRCADRACGHIWLDPRPTPEAIGRAYAGYYTHAEVGANPDLAPGRFSAREQAYLAGRWGYPAADGVGTARLWLHPLIRAELDFSVLWLPARPGGTLFEIGCGNGWALELMQRRGWAVSGIDPDPAAVASARARGLDVTQALPHDLVDGRLDGRFDAVVAVHVLEHVFDPAAFVAVCRRLLRPGGQATLVTPNAGGLGLRRFGRDWRGLEPPRHLHLFNRDTLLKVLRGQGFAAAGAFTSVRDAHNIYVSSMRLRRGEAQGGARPFLLKVAAKLHQLRELAGTACTLPWGEELVGIAKAPG
jgi:2-polyprenyl-3-methyl-5-hydroxy-6-metoxy-1,4-benzoquinol methylase